ncbi:hypothetical protein JOE64_000252 [Microbacterium dextranolyticum]|nr:hypothetical protein [Microbacterium dextranolyticum]
MSPFRRDMSQKVPVRTPRISSYRDMAAPGGLPAPGPAAGPLADEGGACPPLSGACPLSGQPCPLFGGACPRKCRFRHPGTAVFGTCATPMDRPRPAPATRRLARPDHRACPTCGRPCPLFGGACPRKCRSEHPEAAVFGTCPLRPSAAQRVSSSAQCRPSSFSPCRPASRSGPVLEVRKIVGAGMGWWVHTGGVFGPGSGACRTQPRHSSTTVPISAGCASVRLR